MRSSRCRNKNQNISRMRWIIIIILRTAYHTTHILENSTSTRLVHKSHNIMCQIMALVHVKHNIIMFWWRHTWKSYFRWKRTTKISVTRSTSCRFLTMKQNKNYRMMIIWLTSTLCNAGKVLHLMRSCCSFASICALIVMILMFCNNNISSYWCAPRGSNDLWLWLRYLLRIFYFSTLVHAAAAAE